MRPCFQRILPLCATDDGKVATLMRRTFDEQADLSEDERDSKLAAISPEAQDDWYETLRRKTTNHEHKECIEQAFYADKYFAPAISVEPSWQPTAADQVANTQLRDTCESSEYAGSVKALSAVLQDPDSDFVKRNDADNLMYFVVRNLENGHPPPALRVPELGSQVTDRLMQWIDPNSEASQKLGELTVNRFLSLWGTLSGAEHGRRTSNMAYSREQTYGSRYI